MSPPVRVPQHIVLSVRSNKALQPGGHFCVSFWSGCGPWIGVDGPAQKPSSAGEEVWEDEFCVARVTRGRLHLFGRGTLLAYFVPVSGEPKRKWTLFLRVGELENIQERVPPRTHCEIFQRSIRLAVLCAFCFQSMLSSVASGGDL